MKRASYSLYYVNSAFDESVFRVGSRAVKELLVRAQTTPGVTRVDLPGPTFHYLSEEGDECETTVPVVANTKESSRYLDYTRSLLERPSLPLRVRAAHASSRGVQHSVYQERSILGGPTEYANRMAAHTWLAQASGWLSSEHEKQALVAAHSSGGRMPLGELAQALGLTITQTYVVFIRCWFSGRLHWDIEGERIRPGSLVGRVLP